MSASASGGLDPYQNFKFRIMWDGTYVAGASLINGIQPLTEGEIEAAEASGHLKHEPVVLEGVVSGDREFVAWARIEESTSPEPAHDGNPREIVIEQRNGDTLQATYTLLQCWVSEFEALPDMDGNVNLIAIERLQLEHEGVHVRPAG